MKPLLLGGAALLALVTQGSTVHATPFDFTYTGSVVNFTVPTTDTYQILAFGAQGGNGNVGTGIGVGGLGAEIGGDFSLTAGELLQIAVGGAGLARSGGGGGGGSFVVGPGNTPLVIAGGGGGGGGNIDGPLPGGAGLTGPDGGPPAAMVAPAAMVVVGSPAVVAAGFSAPAATAKSWSVSPPASAAVHSRILQAASPAAALVGVGDPGPAAAAAAATAAAGAAEAPQAAIVRVVVAAPSTQVPTKP